MSHEPYSSARAGAPWPPSAPSPGPSRLLPILGVVLGLLGLATGTAAWFRAAPSHSAAPAYSEQQVADAKKAVCEAYAKGVRSMRVVTGRVVDNPSEALPVAVNSRLAEVAVANYFINTAAANPAAPSEIKSMMSQLAKAYEEVALIQLADGTPTDYQAQKQFVNDSVQTLDEICR